MEREMIEKPEEKEFFFLSQRWSKKKKKKDGEFLFSLSPFVVSSATFDD